jgi:Txe/YoeB family toxin of Txe-Axe toxin-antitoxin module
MAESQADYWSRRANEHARMALTAGHRKAVDVHHEFARAYRERAALGSAARVSG